MPNWSEKNLVIEEAGWSTYCPSTKPLNFINERNIIQFKIIKLADNFESFLFTDIFKEI